MKSRCRTPASWAIGIMIVLSWCLLLARRQKKCGAFCTSHDRCKAIYRCAHPCKAMLSQGMPNVFCNRSHGSPPFAANGQGHVHRNVRPRHHVSCRPAPASAHECIYTISCTVRRQDMDRVDLTCVAHGNKRIAGDVLRISEGRERGTVLRAVRLRAKLSLLIVKRF